MVFYNYLCIEYSMVSPEMFIRFCCYYQPHNDSKIMFCRSGNGQFCVDQKNTELFQLYCFQLFMLIYSKIEHVSTNFIFGIHRLPFGRHQDYYFGSKLTMQSGLFFNSVIMVNKSNMADWVSEVLTRKLHCSCFVSLRGTDSSLVCFISYFNKLFYNLTTLCS